MLQCEVCMNESVIYSGIDAWVLGVPVERVGYNCAGIYNKVIGVKEKYEPKVEVSQ